jgi:flagellar FliL protein
VSDKEEEKGKKGGPKKIVMIVVALAVVGVGAKMTVLKSPPAEAGAATTTTVLGGDLVAVEPMSVNLADGHYLKVGVAIELVEGGDAKYFEKAGKPNKVRDLIITTAATRTMADLATAEGKEKFRTELDKGSEKLYKDEYHGIYLTEFVMQ